MKGKLQNFIEINFQNKGIKIAVLSKSLCDSDILLFNKKPDSFGWTLDAEYFIKDENSLNEIFPFINKSYEFVKSGNNSECYKVFREFLAKFVNQANIYNSKDIKIKRSQKLDGAKLIYPAVTIEDIPYKVEMLNTGQCGPKNGEGYRKLPYFGYQLNKIDNSWINIRCGFERFKLTEFKIVKWYSNKQDEDLGYKYLVKDLELESTAEPNDILKEFYDNYGKKQKAIYLYGTFGSGKTYILSALLNKLAEKNIKSIIIHVPELMRSIKESFNDSSYKDKMEALMNVEILLLDDIGAEYLTEWARDEILEPILNYRMENNLATFFTSNYSIDELEKHFSLGSNLLRARRILDRIKTLAKEVDLISESRR